MGLGFFDAENVEATTELDLGEVAPGSSDDSGMWITNDSDMRAEDVVITVYGDNPHCLLLSLDGVTFTASINVGSVAPGGASTPFWVRRITPSSTPTDTISTANLMATPGSWVDITDDSTSDNIPLP